MGFGLQELKQLLKRLRGRLIRDLIQKACKAQGFGALLDLSQSDTIIFEGACRRLEEAEAFDKTAAWLERPYRAIFLNISDSEVEKRLYLRKGTDGRADDASDTVEHRVKEYEENTAHAVEFLKSRGILLDINGEQSVEAVHSEVLKALSL